MHPVLAGVIDADTHGAFALWPMYLLCSLAATLALWIRLVLSSSTRAHHVVSIAPSARTSFVVELTDMSDVATTFQQPRTMNEGLVQRLRTTVYTCMSVVRSRPLIFWLDLFWFILWLLYICDELLFAVIMNLVLIPGLSCSVRNTDQV